MSAVVIDFAEVIARKRAHTAAATAPAVGLRSNLVAPFGGLGTLSHDFTFWRGATGIRYVHTVYTLIDCPELPSANITLVHRHASGRAEVMHICRVEHDAPSLNLAEIRQTAALLGANEVHVHLLADSAIERAAIERDLCGASELASGTLH